jgi:hypothetical protein
VLAAWVVVGVEEADEVDPPEGTLVVVATAEVVDGPVVVDVVV